MEKQHLRILIVEDNPADAELLELHLARSSYDISTKRVQSAAEMRAALEGAAWDLILSDFSMPHFSGVEALEILHSTGRDIPFILISGSAGEEEAGKAMSAGAQDFFTKGSLALLMPAIQRELREAESRATARAQREQLHQNEKLAALGTLLAGIAHELNNPLSVILHQATLLQAELGNDPRQERAGSVLRAVTTCTRIVRNFLALARHDPPRRIPVSLNDVVSSVMELVAYGLKMDHVRVELDLMDSLPVIAGDPQQLERVLLNLVSNAQFVLRSRTEPRILGLRTSRSGDDVLLTVTDNGGGISPDIRTRIFDPFFTTKPTGEGTGLGLSLCHGIVSAHGGTIGVSSEIGAGTTFTVRLPPASDLDVQPDITRPAQSVPSLRVLVVDDDADVAMAFSEILSGQGHDVDIAGSGRAALQKIMTGAYSVVVTDMRMPDLDGPALYQEITNRCPAFNRSFLFVTGDTYSRDTERFLRETGVVYLSKPCTDEEVASAVEEVLRRQNSELVGK